jgi:hypothetical protein
MNAYDLEFGNDAEWGSPQFDNTPLSTQQSIQMQKDANLANPLQANQAKYTDYGLGEEHLGEANAAGVRPVLATGYDQIKQSMANQNPQIPDNSNLLNPQQPLSNQTPAAQQANPQQSALGGALKNGVMKSALDSSGITGAAQGVGSALGGAASSAGSGIMSLLALL